MGLNFFSKASSKIKNFLKFGAKSGVADDVAKAYGGGAVNLADVFNGNVAETVLSDSAETFVYGSKKGMFNRFIDKMSNSSIYNKTKEVLNTVKLGAQEFKNDVIGKNIYETLDNVTEIVKKGSRAFSDGALRHTMLKPEMIEYGKQELKEAKKEAARLHRERKKIPVVKEAKFNHTNSDYRKKLSYMNTGELIGEGKKVGIDDYKDRMRQKYIDAINEVSGDEKFRVYESEKMSMNELVDRAKRLNIDTNELLINLDNDFRNDIYQKVVSNERKQILDSRRVAKKSIVKEATEEGGGIIDNAKSFWNGLDKDGIADWVKENQLVTASALATTGLVAHGLLTDN